jgi:hypothetical protein
LIESIVQIATAFWQHPGVRDAARAFFYLSSVSTVFWMLARCSAVFVYLVHGMLLDEFGTLLAVIFNILLAVAFAGMMFLSAVLGNGPGVLVWREAYGFLFLYLALGAAYMDQSSQDINAYSWPGYVVGLAAYLLFACFPGLLDHREFIDVYRAIAALGMGWFGWLLTGLMVIQIGVGFVRRGLQGMFMVLGPWLWYLRIIRHPPIRIRNDG